MNDLNLSDAENSEWLLSTKVKSAMHDSLNEFSLRIIK